MQRTCGPRRVLRAESPRKRGARRPANRTPHDKRAINLLEKLGMTWQVDASYGVVIVRNPVLIPVQWLPEEILTARSAPARRRLRAYVQKVADCMEVAAA